MTNIIKPTSPLFKKVACCTDIHFGLRKNSREHNQDCEDFFDWFIEEAKKEDCKIGICLGDWHNQRDSLHLSTLKYTLVVLEKLSKAFDKFYIIRGNHDEFYREKRELCGLEFARHIKNIHIVDNPEIIGDVMLVPWLIGDEWKQIIKEPVQYMFGHFELPHFKMNAMVEMPDHGKLNADHFTRQDLVFSGHFHKRQNKGKVWYIGNAFPHNFADAFDDERGMTILEWGGQPKFKAWPNAPKFRSYNISNIIEEKDLSILFDNKTSAKITVDVDLNYEEISEIRSLIFDTYNPRLLSIIPKVNEEEAQEWIADIKFESVDQIVLNQINNIESDRLDKELLSTIYQGV